MDHADHVALLRDAVHPGGVWADIGAGTGAFTLALADLLGTGGRIVAIDHDPGALGQNARAVAARFPRVDLEVLVADFTQPLQLPLLDGLLAANSLHFVPRGRQVDIIRMLARSLRSGGAFAVVEYDANRGNQWVPHPFSYAGWERMANDTGLLDARRLHRVPSSFLGAIYSAVALRP